MKENKICRYCRCHMTFENVSRFTIDKKLTDVNVFSCQHCRTSFFCVGESGKKSKDRKFFTIETGILIQEELMFHDLSVDFCYDESVVYIGRYVTKANNEYRYEVLTSIPMFDIIDMPLERIEKKIRLYMVLS